ncbi:hypothetical protein HZA26_00295 [Candidatus Nomurabacteria bacterium]|nr:hypothetical protein [Candidatus Nomurabacteria bacterium]
MEIIESTKTIDWVTKVIPAGDYELDLMNLLVLGAPVSEFTCQLEISVVN